MATGSSKVASPNTELGEDDLGALYEALYPARNCYKSIGLLIGVKIGEIENIESNKTDSGDRLLAILSVRLNKAEPLIWNEIDSALRSECVDKSRLADKLRQKYGHLFIPESSTESESEQEHEIKSEEIERVKKRAPKKQKGSNHRARVSKERERSSEDEGIETVRSKKHVHEVESEDEEDAVLSRKERKELKGGKPAHDKEQHEIQERFTKYESHSELEIVEGKASKETYHKTRSKPLRGETEYQGERENSSVTEKEKSEKRKGKATRLINFILRRKPKSQDDENSRRVKGKKLSKAAGAPSKDDSHGDKEESDAGGSRDQDDQPKETGEDRKNRETYHKKPPRKEAEGRDGKREVVLRKKAKKVTAPPLERDLPSSEMAQTDSGDGESDESSEDENESKQQSSDEEEETENDSTAEENEEKISEICKEKATHPTTEMRKTKSQDDDTSRRVKGKKLSKAAGAPSKDDSHGDKEESDAGGSRDQEDQPKKKNRRRHRESSKSPIVRGGSSPSSSQEERKPGSRRQRRTPKHGGKYKRKEKKKRRETSSRSSDTDSSSPESEMLKNLTKLEKNKLRKVFKYSFGQLCSASFNPVETAVQLQKKGLISPGMMTDIMLSPESQQEKIIRLVRGLDNRIRSRPERLFGCIEVLLEIDALQEVGREMLRQTGKPFTHQAQGIFVMMCISSFSAGVICPEIIAAKFPRATPSSESAALSEVVGRYM